MILGLGRVLLKTKPKMDSLTSELLKYSSLFHKKTLRALISSNHKRLMMKNLNNNS